MTTKQSTGEATAEEAERPAETLVEAWCRVIRDMPSVGKDKTMEQGQKYQYRSIEQFTGHAATLFAKHGVAVFPTLVEISYEDVGRTSNGNLILEARGVWDWTICWAGGDDKLIARTAGQGRDTSDKAANKAATAAFKYLLMPSLMISDSKDDPDQERIEAGGSVAPQGGGPQWTEQDEESYKDLVSRVKTLSQGPNGKAIIADLLDQAKAAGFEKFTLWAGQKAHLEAATAAVVAHEEREAAIAAQDAAAEAPQEPAKPRGRTTKAKPGSAVTPEELAAVQETFPGAEPVNE